MTDWPSIERLLDALRLHLETNIIPVVKNNSKLYFQTLVSINALKIAQREVIEGDSITRAEWDLLNELTGDSRPYPIDAHERTIALAARNRLLSHDIRAGKYDEPDLTIRLVGHLEKTVGAQLMLNAPALASRFQAEDESGEHPT